MKLYLQQSQFPFMILSDINGVQIEDRPTVQQIEIAPILGFDPKQPVNLIFDLALTDGEVGQLN
jgi:hypothetical protein